MFRKEIKNVELFKKFVAFESRFGLQGVFRDIHNERSWDNEKDKACRKQKRAVHRVAYCMRVPGKKGREKLDGSVEVWKKENADCGHYAGLQTCGSVWVCPICAKKIVEQRAKEIEIIHHQWLSCENHSAIMVTRTIPHKKDDSLSFLVGVLKKASEKFFHNNLNSKSLKGWKKIKSQYGISWRIRSLEITYGYNGWHPHCHELFLLDRKLDQDQMEELKTKLVMLWFKKVESCGLKIHKAHDFFANSVKITPADNAQKYISKFGMEIFEDKKEVFEKWGAGAELAKSHTKIGRSEHYTPWQMAMTIYENLESKSAFQFYGKRLREYSQVMKGLHQIKYDRGMKKYFGIKDLEDLDIAASEEKDESIFLGVLHSFQWQCVLKNKARAKVLILAGQKGWDEVVAFVSDLCCKNSILIKFPPGG